MNRSCPDHGEFHSEAEQLLHDSLCPKVRTESVFDFNIRYMSRRDDHGWQLQIMFHCGCEAIADDQGERWWIYQNGESCNWTQGLLHSN